MNVELPEPTRLTTSHDLLGSSGSGLPGTKSLRAAGGKFQIARLLLTDGPSRGVELLIVDTGRVRGILCPTRGMSLWKARVDDLPLGWKSPVEGPIHPNLVPLAESSGLGWLDGFDELLVRCGMRSFGAPDFDDQGNLLHGLHGRVGNLPARNLRLELDEAHSLLHVQAEVHESRFLQYNLRLEVQYTFAIDQPTIAVRDIVTNAGGTPATMQMLYHINVGAPLLAEDAKLWLTARRVVARNPHAADGLSQWETYLPPTPGYAEQVYFFDPSPDQRGWAHAMLTSPTSDRAFVVRYRTDTLPYFTQWKNTVADSDGYVTGLEPGTGFPNPRSFEEQKGRLVELGPGESREFHLELEGVTTAERVSKLKQEMVPRAQAATQQSAFDADWCVGEQ